MSRRSYDIAQRAADIAGAAILLLLSAPLLLVVAALVWLNLGSPVLFSQQRPGRNSKPFMIKKFRTMLVQGDSQETSDDEARLSRFGHALRSTSLDELPTLFNVLRGDMSFVGPRPLLMHYLPRYSKTESRRHEVRPGITGLAQVSGRNSTTWNERLALDVIYVDSRSPALNLRILARTVGVVFVRSGVRAEGHATMSEFRGNGVTADEHL